MKRMRYLFFLVLSLLLFFISFHTWFSAGNISSGDTGYYYNEVYLEKINFLNAWALERGSGLGGINIPFLWSSLDVAFPIWFLGIIFHLDWSNIQKIAYGVPFLAVSIVSSNLLFVKIFKNKYFSLITGFLYTANTYIFMIVGGGQFLIGLSYALIPLILLQVINLIEKSNTEYKVNLRLSLLLGIALAIQVLLDIRVVYITILIIILYFFTTILLEGLWMNIAYIIKKILFIGFIPVSICIIINAFWLLPIIVTHQNPIQQLGAAYNTTEAVNYLSFAKFENSIGLLHPNWPDNIFGKVGFMKPEFLLLPVLAFASLFFISIKTGQGKKDTKNILFFVVVGLVGAFLAKGSNPPFGSIYLWMFGYVPGFSMFRDPTKWYGLISLSYAILIPFSVQRIYLVLINNKSKERLLLGKLFIIVVILGILWTIFPSLQGKLSGTFADHLIPHEYTNLAKQLSADKSFYRTFWIPTVPSYSYYSFSHPQISAEDLFQVNSTDKALNIMERPDSEKLLQYLSVKYVLIPIDSEKRIFLADRKFDSEKYEKTINSVKKIPWLIPVNAFGNLSAFQLKDYKDHFWIENDINAKITYQSINPTKYMLTVKNAKRGDRVVFTDSYDENWQLTVGSQKVSSLPYDRLLNSFILPKDGNYSGTVYFTPQKWVDIGVWISGITLFALIAYLLLDLFYTKRHE